MPCCLHRWDARLFAVSGLMQLRNGLEQSKKLINAALHDRESRENIANSTECEFEPSYKRVEPSCEAR